MADRSPTVPSIFEGQPQDGTNATTATRAALMIDVENLFEARKRAFEEKHHATYKMNHLADDLTLLSNWIGANMKGLQLTVRRGYADFRRHRWETDPTTRERGRKYYLRGAEEELMKLGIEPVQVYALAAGKDPLTGQSKSGKNAVDLRIAMDAALCVLSPAAVETVLLVAGDSDYVPVVLQLRRLGAETVVVGFREATGRYLAAFANRFRFFEELVEEDATKVARAVDQQQRADLPPSVSYYRMVLEGQEPRFVLVPHEHWITITDAIYQSMAAPRAGMKPDDLVDYIRLELGPEGGDAGGFVSAVVSQLLDAGCFRASENGSALPDGEREICLAPELDNVETMRMRTRQKIMDILERRLDNLGDFRPLQAKVIAKMFFGTNPSATDMEAAEKLLPAKARGAAGG